MIMTMVMVIYIMMSMFREKTACKKVVASE